jgi:membrane fusion protein, multidrug efflux system
MRKRLILLVLPLVLLAGLYGGWQWWHVWRYEQSTDDAYIQSDISVISPKIEGYIKDVRVQDNQQVKAGDVLFVIDDSDFAAKVAQAAATVQTAEATVSTFDTRQEFQQAMIGQASAEVRRPSSIARTSTSSGTSRWSPARSRPSSVTKRRYRTPPRRWQIC